MMVASIHVIIIYASKNMNILYLDVSKSRSKRELKGDVK